MIPVVELEARLNDLAEQIDKNNAMARFDTAYLEGRDAEAPFIYQKVLEEQLRINTRLCKIRVECQAACFEQDTLLHTANASQPEEISSPKKSVGIVNDEGKTIGLNALIERAKDLELRQTELLQSIGRRCAEMQVSLILSEAELRESLSDAGRALVSCREELEHYLEKAAGVPPEHKEQINFQVFLKKLNIDMLEARLHFCNLELEKRLS